MISFPNAKINLGLNIVEKRPDGFHNIETIFYPIGLKDALEFVVKAENKTSSLTISGIEVDGEINNNLIMKAYKMIKLDYGLPCLNIYLQKNIPFGAGLGGGSADAAFMLNMLNTHFQLGLSIVELENYAGRLGADCPFFIQNKAIFASGIGEVFENTTISLNGYYIILIKPDIYVSTPLAYASCKPHRLEINLQDIVKRPIEEWSNLMKNDFEESVFILHPEIAALKSRLYEHGAMYASMSGSGSSVFGIFKTQPTLKNEFSSCFVWEGKLD